jgi:arginine-tRNA-protein transferase
LYEHPQRSGPTKIQFYVTAPYACSYLPNQIAQSLIATPQDLVDGYQYSGLIQQGFRRGGKFVYRLHCESCQACVSVPLPVREFQPSRSQKRAFKQHQSLEVSISRLNFNEAQFALNQAYQAARHQDAKDDTVNKEEKDSAS